MAYQYNIDFYRGSNSLSNIAIYIVYKKIRFKKLIVFKILNFFLDHFSKQLAKIDINSYFIYVVVVVIVIIGIRVQDIRVCSIFFSFINPQLIIS